MVRETWRPVATTYIETRTQDERKYGVTAIIYCDEPLDIAICRRVEESRYPELDASIEAGDELERWKERCHALETENAALQSWCRAVEERLKADIDQQKEDMAETARLRALLPGKLMRMSLRQIIREWCQHTGVKPDAVIVMDSMEWLQRLEAESEEP